MRRTASEIIRDLEIRIARLEKQAGRVHEERATLDLPNGSKLIFSLFWDGSNSRFAFQLDRGAYFAYDSRRNFSDMLSSLQDMNIEADVRTQGRKGKPAVLKFPDGEVVSVNWFASGPRGEIRLGFAARGASYFAYGSSRNFHDMVSDLQDHNLIALDD